MRPARGRGWVVCPRHSHSRPPPAVRECGAYLPLTLEYGSCSRQASRMASDTLEEGDGDQPQLCSQVADGEFLRHTWSQSLSGWPSFTDSLVKRKVSPSAGILRHTRTGRTDEPHAPPRASRASARLNSTLSTNPMHRRAERGEGSQAVHSLNRSVNESPCARRDSVCIPLASAQHSHIYSSASSPADSACGPSGGISRRPTGAPTDPASHLQEHSALLPPTRGFVRTWQAPRG